MARQVVISGDVVRITGFLKENVIPRLPYPPAELAEPSVLIDAIRRRRGEKLLNLDRMLLHSLPLAKAWNGFLGDVRAD